MLAERLKRCTSTPCIQAIQESDISESYVDYPGSNFYSVQELNRNAGILMAPSEASVNRLHGFSENDLASTSSYYLDSNLIEAVQKLQLQSESCSSCLENQKAVGASGLDQLPRMMYRQPPPYCEPANPDQRSAFKPSPEKYRHPPPYRKPEGISSETSSLGYQTQYTSKESLDSTSIYKLTPGQHPYTGLTREQFLINSSSTKGPAKTKIDQTAMTDAYLYPGYVDSNSSASLEYYPGERMYQGSGAQETVAYQFPCGEGLCHQPHGYNFSYYTGQRRSSDNSNSDTRSDAFSYGIYHSPNGSGNDQSPAMMPTAQSRDVTGSVIVQQPFLKDEYTMMPAGNSDQNGNLGIYHYPYKVFILPQIKEGTKQTKFTLSWI